MVAITTGSDRTGTPRRFPAGRKAELAAYVSEAGQVTVAEIAERFDVSTDTIRRDLDRLAEDGLLVRTHGGAMSTTAVPQINTGFDNRLGYQSEAKEKIGALAATLVDDNSVVMINAGTTTVALARELKDHRGLTVATNSLRLPPELSTDCFRGLYVFGGAVHIADQKTIGPVSFHSSTGQPRPRRPVRPRSARRGSGLSRDGVLHEQPRGGDHDERDDGAGVAGRDLGGLVEVRAAGCSRRSRAWGGRTTS